MNLWIYLAGLVVISVVTGFIGAIREWHYWRTGIVALVWCISWCIIFEITQ